MIPADARKELEDRLEECIDIFVANKDALVDLNAPDVSGFKEIMNTLEEEAEHMVEIIAAARTALMEDN